MRGTGVGPQVNFLPGTQSTVAGGLKSPGGVAVDAKGNVYIANTNSSSVLKEAFSAGSYAQSSLGTELSAPAGVAVDGAGNIYIADYTGDAIYKETLAAGSYTQSTVPTGSLSGPSGVAADGSGNVYIVDSGNDRVLKETLTDGSYSESVVASSTAGGLEEPSGVAVDGGGNVYITDDGLNEVLKETLSGSSYTQSVFSSSDLSSPKGIAVDGTGSVYFVDSGNHRVWKKTPSAGSYIRSTVPTTGLVAPVGVAVDGYGNVYISDQGTSQVLKVDFYDPPSLTYAATNVGTVSSPQTVTLENVGSAALTFPVWKTQNPYIYPGFTLNSTVASACPLVISSAPVIGTLAAGADCLLPVSFAPIAPGSISSWLVVADNNLNVADNSQTIPLSGIATSTTVSLSATKLSYGGVNVGSTSASQSVTLTNTGSATLSIISIGVTGLDASSFVFANNCAGLAAGASCSIHGHFAPAAVGAVTAAITISDSATGTPQSIALAGTGTNTTVSLSATKLSYGGVNVGTATRRRA